MLTQPVRRRSEPSSEPARRSGGANDNRRGQGPANDNRFPQRPRVPLNPARLARYGRNLLRLNPYFRLASDAMSVLDILSNGGRNMAGWELYFSCRSGGTVRRQQINASQSGACDATLTTENIWNNALGQIGPHGNVTGYGYCWRLFTWHRDPAPSPGAYFNRYAGEYWLKPRSSPSEPEPSIPANRAAIALPSNAPAATWVFSQYPELAPPFQAPAFPKPRPFNKPNLPDGLNSSRSNGARRPRPIREVANNWSMSFEDGPTEIGAPKTHILAPPSSRGPRAEKESKVKAPSFVTQALHYVAPFTEMIDFVEALYDALPEEYRPRYKDTPYEKMHTTTQEKFAALYQNFDKVNLFDALQNIVSMEIEDRIYGTFGKMGAEASKRQGLSQGGGFNSALRPIRKYMFEYNSSSGVDNSDE